MFRLKLNLQNDKPSIIIIGGFDGLHLGHMQAFKMLKQKAHQYNYKKIALTFEPLPREYFARYRATNNIGRLSLIRDKYQWLKDELLVDELVILHFNHFLSTLSPDEFIVELKTKLNVKHVVAFDDFRFAKDRVGTLEDFRRHSIEVTHVEPLEINNVRVSSTFIRSLLSQNQLSKAAKYLGRNLQYTSRVIHGKKLGRTLGAATINLALKSIKPAIWGIYVAKVYIDGVCYPAVASVGQNPTVTTDTSYKIEAHLLDVDLDLYGKIAKVEFLEFLRPELKFNSITELKDQIKEDILKTHHYFSRI